MLNNYMERSLYMESEDIALIRNIGSVDSVRVWGKWKCQGEHSKAMYTMNKKHRKAEFGRGTMNET